MSLFQCPTCGCMENTALCPFTYPELRVCSACSPKGKWHGKFERIYLPKGEFFTNGEGNLEHRATGSIDVRKFAIEAKP